jgi:hypothetical protein
MRTSEAIALAEAVSVAAFRGIQFVLGDFEADTTPR